MKVSIDKHGDGRVFALTPSICLFFQDPEYPSSKFVISLIWWRFGMSFRFGETVNHDNK